MNDRNIGVDVVEVTVEDWGNNGTPYYCGGWQAGKSIGEPITKPRIYSGIFWMPELDPNLLGVITARVPSDTFNPGLLETELLAHGIRPFKAHRHLRGNKTIN